MEGEAIGIAGVAIVTVREVFLYLQNKKLNGGAGQKSVEFWDEKFTKIISACLNASVLPILKSQTEILGRMEDYQRETYGMLKKMEK